MGLQAGIVGLPNVGKSTLFNALSNAKAQCIIYNMNGNIVEVNYVTAGSNQVYVNNLNAGIYEMKIIRENGDVTTKKLVVSRQ